MNPRYRREGELANCARLPADETGHSDQLFAVAVEAAIRILSKRITETGVGSAETMLDAVDFLNAVAPTITWRS